MSKITEQETIDFAFACENISKSPKDWACMYLHVYQQREMARAILRKHVDWFKHVQNHQRPLLQQGYEKACDNWDKATDIEPLDMADAIKLISDIDGAANV